MEEAYMPRSGLAELLLRQRMLLLGHLRLAGLKAPYQAWPMGMGFLCMGLLLEKLAHQAMAYLGSFLQVLLLLKYQA